MVRFWPWMVDSQLGDISMVLMLAWASESITKIFLSWWAASVSASVRTSVDLPTPPFAFMTVMELRMGNPAKAPFEHPHRQGRQWPNQGEIVTISPTAVVTSHSVKQLVDVTGNQVVTDAISLNHDHRLLKHQP